MWEITDLDEKVKSLLAVLKIEDSESDHEHAKNRCWSRRIAKLKSFADKFSTPWTHGIVQRCSTNVKPKKCALVSLSAKGTGRVFMLFSAMGFEIEFFAVGVDTFLLTKSWFTVDWSVSISLRSPVEIVSQSFRQSVF